MSELIDGLLELARQGQSIGETAPVDVESVARDAWALVDAADATLVVESDGTVEADGERLRALLENLFRNSVEHGGTADADGAGVTITVGPLGEGRPGFFVADDGPGIPESERDQVLEHGYTTEPGGTGLGLSIVASIADAHGWEITVTESDIGGARFEVDCEPAAEDVVVEAVPE